MAEILKDASCSLRRELLNYRIQELIVPESTRSGVANVRDAIHSLHSMQPNGRELAQELGAAWDELQGQFSYTRDNAIAIAWIPPSATESEFLEASANDFPIIAMSCLEVVTGDGASLKKPDGSCQWTSLFLASRYLSTSVSYVDLPTDVSSLAQITAKVDELIAGFSDESQRCYFSRKVGQIRYSPGAKNVWYARPAFVVLFLPGMSGNMDGDFIWPTSSIDYEFVTAFRERLSPDVAVFGGSAVGGSGHGNSSGSKVGASGLQSISKGFWGKGIAAAVVQCDLRFGVAGSSGFEITEDLPIRFHVAEEHQSKKTNTYPLPNRMKRFHKLDCIDSMDNVEVLATPAERSQPTKAILSKETNEVYFFALTEYDEIIPNPAYKGPNDEAGFQFLVPLRNGEPLFTARLTYESAVGAVEAAVDAAKESAGILNPQLALVANCRGRMRLLYDLNSTLGVAAKDLKLEWDNVNKKGYECFAGFYGNGETYSTTNRVPIHRNWSVSALVVGCDENPLFLSAATEQAISRLERSFAKNFGIEEIADGIRKETQALLDLDDCHVRIIGRKGKELQMVSQTGVWASKLSEIASSISVEKKDDWYGMTSRECYLGKTPVVKSGREILALIKKHPTHWPEWESLKDLIEEQRYQWFGSIPLFDGTQCFGTVSFASRSYDQFSRDGILDTCKNVGRRFANPFGTEVGDEDLGSSAVRLLSAARLACAGANALRIAIQQDIERQLATAIISIGTEKELSAQISECAASLLGPPLKLQLLLPDRDFKYLIDLNSSPRAKEVSSSLRVSISDGSTMQERGITGYCFIEGHDLCVPNISNIASTAPYRFNSSLSVETVTEYVLVVRSPSDNSVLGVLNAESSEAGILSEDRHGACLRAIANKAAFSLTQIRLNREAANRLEAAESEAKRLISRQAGDERFFSDRTEMLLSLFACVLFLGFGAFCLNVVASREAILSDHRSEISRLQSSIETSIRESAGQIPLTQRGNRKKLLDAIEKHRGIVWELESLAAGGSRDDSDEGHARTRQYLNTNRAHLFYATLLLGALGGLSTAMSTGRTRRNVPLAIFLGGAGGVVVGFFFCSVLNSTNVSETTEHPLFHFWMAGLLSFFSGVVCARDGLYSIVLAKLRGAIGLSASN